MEKIKTFLWGVIFALVFGIGFLLGGDSQHVENEVKVTFHMTTK